MLADTLDSSLRYTLFAAYHATLITGANMLQFRSIETSTFGVEVDGLDLRDEVDVDTVRQIVENLHEHRVVIIKNQRLEQEPYLAFSRRLGRPDIHPLDYAHMAGFPEIETIGNTQPKDREEAIRNGAAFWHTEHAYEADPISALMFYALKVPRVGGETWVADMRSAYDDLDDATKTRIDGLIVKHDYLAAQGGNGETSAAPIKTEEQAARVPPVRHYLAPTHPVTGRKSLYAVTGFIYGIEGMEDHDALELLANLKAHAVQPRYLYQRKHVVGDIMLLDTLQTLHRGTQLEFTTGEDDARLLWNIAVKGPPETCRENWQPCEPRQIAIS